MESTSVVDAPKVESSEVSDAIALTSSIQSNPTSTLLSPSTQVLPYSSQSKFSETTSVNIREDDDKAPLFEHFLMIGCAEEVSINTLFIHISDFK